MTEKMSIRGVLEELTVPRIGNFIPKEVLDQAEAQIKSIIEEMIPKEIIKINDECNGCLNGDKCNVCGVIYFNHIITCFKQNLKGELKC